jgi:hypothetical protein
MFIQIKLYYVIAINNKMPCWRSLISIYINTFIWDCDMERQTRLLPFLCVYIGSDNLNHGAAETLCSRTARHCLLPWNKAEFIAALRVVVSDNELSELREPVRIVANESRCVLSLFGRREMSNTVIVIDDYVFVSERALGCITQRALSMCVYCARTHERDAWAR